MSAGVSVRARRSRRRGDSQLRVLRALRGSKAWRKALFPERTDIRLALPSKGRLADDALDFLAEAGLRVYKPNPRQFEATIPSLPGLTVLFQRAGDIAVSVRDGSVDFGITGWDAVCERCGDHDDLLPLHRGLGFGYCTLNAIVPQA